MLHQVILELGGECPDPQQRGGSLFPANHGVAESSLRLIPRLSRIVAVRRQLARRRPSKAFKLEGSAPGDILRFARLFLQGGSVDGVQILEAETVALMMSDHLGERAP